MLDTTEYQRLSLDNAKAQRKPVLLDITATLYSTWICTSPAPIWHRDTYSYFSIVLRK